MSYHTEPKTLNNSPIFSKNGTVMLPDQNDSVFKTLDNDDRLENLNPLIQYSIESGGGLNQNSKTVDSGPKRQNDYRLTAKPPKKDLNTIEPAA